MYFVDVRAAAVSFLLLGATTANPLATLTPCAGAASTINTPITVTSQYQPVSTCTASTSACHRSHCSTKYAFSTYDFVSTTIPCDWNGTVASSTLVTTTNQPVTIGAWSTTLTSFLPLGTGARYGNYTHGGGQYGNHTNATRSAPIPVYSTIIKTFVVDYNEIGPLAIPGYAGSGLCELCEPKADGSRSQPVNVTECRSGPLNSTMQCSQYNQVWVSQVAPSSTSKTTATVQTTSQFSASTAGVYTFIVPQTAAPATITSEATVYTVTPSPYYVSTTKSLTAGSQDVVLIITVTETITYNLPNTASQTINAASTGTSSTNGNQVFGHGWGDWNAVPTASSSGLTPFAPASAVTANHGDPVVSEASPSGWAQWQGSSPTAGVSAASDVNVDGEATPTGNNPTRPSVAASGWGQWQGGSSVAGASPASGVNVGAEATATGSTPVNPGAGAPGWGRWQGGSATTGTNPASGVNVGGEATATGSGNSWKDWSQTQTSTSIGADASGSSPSSRTSVTSTSFVATSLKTTTSGNSGITTTLTTSAATTTQAIISSLTTSAAGLGAGNGVITSSAATTSSLSSTTTSSTSGSTSTFSISVTTGGASGKHKRSTSYLSFTSSDSAIVVTDKSQASDFYISNGDLMYNGEYVVSDSSSGYIPFGLSTTPPTGTETWALDSAGDVTLSDGTFCMDSNNNLFIVLTAAPTSFTCTPVSLIEAGSTSSGASTSSSLLATSTTGLTTSSATGSTSSGASTSFSPLTTSTTSLTTSSATGSTSSGASTGTPSSTSTLSSSLTSTTLGSSTTDGSSSSTSTLSSSLTSTTLSSSTIDGSSTTDGSSSSTSDAGSSSSTTTSSTYSTTTTATSSSLTSTTSDTSSTSAVSTTITPTSTTDFTSSSSTVSTSLSATTTPAVNGPSTNTTGTESPNQTFKIEVGSNNGRKYRKRQIQYVYFPANSDDAELTSDPDEATLFMFNSDGYLVTYPGAMYVQADTSSGYLAFSISSTPPTGTSYWTVGTNGGIVLQTAAGSGGFCVTADNALIVTITSAPGLCTVASVNVEGATLVVNTTTTSATTTTTAPTADPSADLDDEPTSTTTALLTRRTIAGRSYGHHGSHKILYRRH